MLRSVVYVCVCERLSLNTGKSLIHDVNKALMQDQCDKIEKLPPPGAIHRKIHKNIFELVQLMPH